MTHPTRVGDGPVTCSTSLVLTISPEWVADVNGYYRDLGIDPRASKGDIARAYFERGRDDAHLTFVVKQLLNPEVRRAYDRTPMGHVFLDEEVVARLRAEIARRNPGVSLVSEAPAMLIPEPQGPALADFPGAVDKSSWSVDDGPRTASAAWPYSYFRWDADHVDEGTLRRWQEDLTVSLGRAGHRMRIAVGVVGGAHSEVEVHLVEGSPTVFLHENSRSTHALVDRAVTLLTHNTPHTTHTTRTPQNRDQKMSETKPSFRRGTEEAKEASKGAAFAKTHYFGLSADPDSPENSAILRFITDYNDLIVVDQHASVPTKAAPKDYDGTSWPSKMGAVCRKDQAIAGMFEDCYICDNLVDGKAVKRATARSWAYAVLREEVFEDGEVVGVRDVLREVADVDEKGKATGSTHMEKAIVVVNMAYKNFFSTLEGFVRHYGTLLDRDYKIRRNGDGTSTTYQIIPLERIVVDDEGTVFDLRDPQFADRYQPTESLDDVVLDRASDDFYARFFDRRVSAPASSRDGGGDKGSKATPAESAPERPASDAGSKDRLAALAGRVKDYAAPKEEQAEPAPEKAPEEAPAEKAEEKAPAKKKGAMRQFD